VPREGHDRFGEIKEASLVVKGLLKAFDSVLYQNGDISEIITLIERLRYLNRGAIVLKDCYALKVVVSSL
jgi:hypothetical protein